MFNIRVIERLHNTKHRTKYMEITEYCMSCKHFSSINKCFAYSFVWACAFFYLTFFFCVRVCFFFAVCFSFELEKFVINVPIRTVCALHGHDCLNCNKWFYCRFAVWQLKWNAQHCRKTKLVNMEREKIMQKKMPKKQHARSIAWSRLVSPL